MLDSQQVYPDDFWALVNYPLLPDSLHYMYLKEALPQYTVLVRLFGGINLQAETQNFLFQEGLDQGHLDLLENVLPLIQEAYSVLTGMWGCYQGH